MRAPGPRIRLIPGEGWMCHKGRAFGWGASPCEAWEQWVAACIRLALPVRPRRVLLVVNAKRETA